MDKKGRERGGFDGTYLKPEAGCGEVLAVVLPDDDNKGTISSGKQGRDLLQW